MPFLTCASPHIQAVEIILTRKRRLVILACLPLLQNAPHLHPLRQHLFSSGELANWEGRDAFTLFARILRVTGETVETFSEMLVAVGTDLGNQLNLSPRNVIMIL